MSEFFGSLPGLITLISSGLVLLGGLITLGCLLSSKIKEIIKDKNWSKIVQMALVAIQEAEKTGASGADKKVQVIEAVKAGCKEIDIDCTACLDDLSTYIDNCISFVNSMKK